MRRLALVALCLVSLSAAPEARTLPVHPPARWLAPRGAALSLFGPAFERRGLAFPPDACELAERGADTVLLPVLLEQWGARGSEVRWSAEGVDRRTLRAVMRRARGCGLRVVLAPLLEVRGGEPGVWRARIRPADEDAWWRSYGANVLELAGLASDEGAHGLVVSHELTSLSRSRDAWRWRALCRRVRGRWRGPLAAVVNHDALDARLPFEAFDVVGVSAYFPLTHRLDPDAAELARGWRRASARLEAFHRRVRRPLVLFEVGYPSLDGAASAPWDHTIGAPVDLEEQAMAYRAAVDALERMRFVEGALFWSWGGPGGRWDRGFTVRGKPAERELRRYFANQR